jgi:DNA-binding NtrC family response regulator
LPLFGSEKLIGESEALYRLFDLISAASQTNQNVLIQGEPGSGKSLVARTIHSQSERSENWLIVVNCALTDASGLESILLGPSGLSSEGVFEAASGGTVAFDHVDQLGADAQSRLNHILETHSFACDPVRQPSAFDVRLLFLTTRSLSDGDFEKTLYYRLNQFSLRVPPLRTRSEDIVHLARHFLRRQQRSGEVQSEVEKALSQDAKAALRRYDWPGNVRELRNAIRRATILSEASTIEKRDLPPSVREPESSDFIPEKKQSPEKASREPTPAPRVEQETDADAVEGTNPFFTETSGEIPEIEELKREAVERAYTLCDGDVDRAAVELGIARSTMYRLLKRYDLK